MPFQNNFYATKQILNNTCKASTMKGNIKLSFFYNRKAYFSMTMTDFSEPTAVLTIIFNEIIDEVK